MKLRKQLSVLVAVAMIIGCMPGFVLATETEETQTPTEQTTEVLEDEDQTIDSVVDEDEPEEVTEEEQEEETVETTEFDVESDVYTVEPANQSASEIITTWGDLKTALEDPDNAGQTFKLGDDIDAPQDATYIAPVNGVILDLNNHTIYFRQVAQTSDSYFFSVGVGITFTIRNGSLIAGRSSSCAGAIMNRGNLYLEGVTLTGNTGKYGAVYSLGYLSLNNVSITGNTATIETTDSNYSQYLGGGVHSEGELHVRGLVNISSNVCIAAMSSNIGKDLYLAAGKTITIDGDLDDNSLICVSGANLPNVITSGWNGRSNYSVFSSEVFNTQVREDGEVYLVAHYMSRSWDNGLIETPVIISTPVSFITNSDSELSEGTYYVYRNERITNRLIVSSGTVNIIVKDGVTLTLLAGIEVREGATLYIYSQSNDLGKIVAYGSSDVGGAAIGGNSREIAGEINICGGQIEATGTGSAGIGGGHLGDASVINIFGGSITSTGNNGGSGIGDGSYAKQENEEGGVNSGNCRINIYGGTVNARGANGGAGIGGGCYDSIVRSINIWGGTIRANGHYAAGIGGGYVGSVDTVNIYGGDVVANGDNGGAGIGGGYYRSAIAINIYDGTVVSTGSIYESAQGSDGAAGIGGGAYGGVGIVNIYGGTVTAQGCGGGTDIGAGYYYRDTDNLMRIGFYGGTINLPEPDVSNTAHVGLSLNSDIRNLRIDFGDVRIYDVSSGSYIQGTTRVTACNTQAQGRLGDLIISPCDHSDRPEYFEYREYSGIDDAHNRVCMYCEHVYSESHHYENGVCVCGRVEGNAPQFVGHSVQLSGQIGLQYFFTLPDGAENCYVTFEHNDVPLTVRVTPETSTKPGSGTYYMAQLDLSTIQIADSFVPVIHYTINGNEETVSGTAYSVMDYINWGVAENNITTSDSEKNILNRLADYGYYAQLYLSNLHPWTIGSDYTAVNLGREPMPLDLDEIRDMTAPYAIDKTVDSSTFDRVTFSLRFGDQLSLRIIFEPATGATIDRSLFRVNGEPVTAARLSDGSYAVTITDISALRLNEVFTITYSGSESTDANATVIVSPLSYVNAMLNLDSNYPGKRTVCALYNYAVACGMIIQTNGN